MLSLHAPGNFKQADLGGVEGKLCKTSSSVLKIFFQELNKNIPSGWQATMECTHHGPLIETPCLFIEIGSNPKNWPDKEAGRAIANTVKQAIDRVNSERPNFKSAIAIGGGHYCPNFNKIQSSSEYAISHVIPEYILPINEKILKESIDKTVEKPDTAILDWKGLGKSEQKQELVKLLEKMNMKIIRTKEVTTS